jgi:murein DD-endopeptidase MepM/ murein hydrolase activator NlpD
MRHRALPIAIAAIAFVVALVWTAAEARSERRLPVAAPLVVTQAFEVRADTLRRNETLSHLFARHAIEGPELLSLLEAADGINPRRMAAGQVFQFRYAVNEAHPNRVMIRLGDERVLTLRRDTGRMWRGESDAIVWSVELRRVEGVIRSSLYEALDEYIPDSVLPPNQRPLLLWDLADGVFGWVIDFTRDNYEGDDFVVLYERLTSGLGDVRYGRVVAARIESRGNPHTAYVMTDGQGRNQYYDANGRSLKRAFKLYPVPSFRYISSGFSRRRFHPVLKTHRAHLGVDYAAVTGTPIVATGDGTVSRAGRWGGYGITVSVRHPKDIETRYAHMSRIRSGIRPGVRVQQGQIIGYVGMTGLANAPHVHYEFLKNGAQRDPRSAGEFGEGEPVPPDRRGEFESLQAYYELLFLPRPAESIAAGTD